MAKGKPKFFEIVNWKNWKIERPEHYKYILTNDDGQTFQFSIELHDFEVQLCILYNEKVVMYSGVLTDKMKTFWFDLGDAHWRTEENIKNVQREFALKSWDWDWE